MKQLPIRVIDPGANKPEISKTFRIRPVEEILGGQDMNQPTHRHNFFFILALKKGKGTHTIDFNRYPITDHCLFLIRPGQVHQLQLKASSTGYLVEFNTEFYQVHHSGIMNALRKAFTANYCKPSPQSFDTLNTVLENIYKEYTHAEAGYHEIIRAQLDIFFIQFQRNSKKKGADKTKETTYEQERLEEFMDLIEKHVTVKKRVSDYTGMLNLSAYQLSAITKRLLQKTPSEIIDQYIILEAKRYLLGSTDQVNQIAWTLGYEDPSYFIRFFKKHTGYSPEAFRTKHQKIVNTK